MNTPAPAAGPTPAQSSKSVFASGLAPALGAYLIWGFLPLYLLLVKSVPPFEFVGWRIIWTLPLCLLIVALFAFIVIRALTKVMREENLFVLLAVGGLAVQFGLQAMINMASSLHMMPTKGMTLPFISYGGSSLVALGVAVGMILALTRRRRDMEGRQ